MDLNKSQIYDAHGLDRSRDKVKPKQQDSPITVSEKLDIIDHELRTLHKFCIEHDSSTPLLLVNGGEPLWLRMREARRQRYLKAIIIAAVAVGCLSILAQYDPVSRFSYAYFRIATIKVLPYWDWTSFYRNGCFLENPYFNKDNQELVAEDCNICEHLETLKRISNVSQAEMTNNYIQRDIPVIVTDALVDWPAQKLYTLKFLSELYNTDDVLKAVPPCVFVSNVRLKSGSAKQFLAKAHKGELSNWYAHWENCEKQAVRVVRQFYRRPYFLPAMVEVADRNWILISSDYNAKKFKPVDLATPLMWLVQLRGQNKIKLVPRSPCNETCTTMYKVLHEGEMLVWTDLMWLVDYLPVSCGSVLSVAVMSGGYFD